MADNNISKLSIIIPAFNEAATLVQVLDKIFSVQLLSSLQKEVIIINDGSADDTALMIEKYVNGYPHYNIRIISHTGNKGKGRSIQTGIQNVTGEYTIIQDADLEYDPEEYNLLLQPALAGFADVVYGSRLLSGKPHRILFYWHSIGNRLLTMLSNIFTNLNLTDMECGYKLFRTELLKKIRLKEKRFGFEPEITAKIARLPNIRIYEVGISYYGRTYKEGKKIKWIDGFRAIYCIIKYGLFRIK